MFQRRSSSEPSLHNSVIRSNHLPPLTLGDLEDSEGNPEDAGYSLHEQSLKWTSDDRLNKSPLSRRIPSANSQNGSFLYNSSSALQQSNSGNSYRVLNYRYPSATSQITSNSRTTIDEDYLTSHDLDKRSSENFVELVADPRSLSESDKLFFSPMQPLRHNSLSDSILSENNTENMHFIRPTSARSNSTSVTMLNEDMERQRLHILQDHNNHLNSLVSSLQSQLSLTKSRQNQDNEMIKETMISLKEEADTNEKALRNAEEALERAEMICEERTNSIADLKGEIHQLQQRLQDTESSIKTVTKNYEEACRDASHLAQQLEQVQLASRTSQKTCDEEIATCQKEVRCLQAENMQSAITMEKLEHANLKLQTELRDALKEITSKEVTFSEQKVCFQEQVDDLNAQFASLRADLEMKTDQLERAVYEKQNVEKELEDAQDDAKDHQDRLQSCEMELAEVTNKLQNLEKEIVAKQMENAATVSDKPSTDDPIGTSIGSFDENCKCDVKSPRKVKAYVAELKMNLAAKDAQIQRLEARLSTYAAETDKLENIRGDLINFVERSKSGDKRISQLEGIVLQLEEERSKVTRKVMEYEDELNDKKAEHDSLETRLSERTYAMKQVEGKFDEAEKALHKLQEENSSFQRRKYELENALKSKTRECINNTEKINHLNDELDRKDKALENAAEWTAKKEAENKREMMKMKKITAEQHESMEKEIDRLQEISSKYKDQAQDMECRLCQLQQQNEDLIGQLKSKHEELDLFMEEHVALKKKSEESLEKLTKDAHASAGQVEHLQSSLEHYKNEISEQMLQLQSANERFNHSVAMKDQEVAKLKASLTVACESLKCKDSHIHSLEQLLVEKEAKSDGLSEKLIEFQECNSCMKSKISKLESHLNEVTKKAMQEKEFWDERIQSAFSELTAKNDQFTKLNDALKQVEKEFDSCREELVVVEHNVKVLEAESSEKGRQLSELQNREKSATTALGETSAKVITLERLLEDASNKYKSVSEKCRTHEDNFLQSQTQIELLSKESNQLKANLQSAENDIDKKTSSITRLQNALRDVRNSLLEKERHVEELERSLDDRQWELTQRAAQLGKLETTVKEHKSLTDKRNIELQSEVKKTKIELKERNAQLGNLDEQLYDLRRETQEQRHVVEEKDQDLRHLTEELKNKNEQLGNLEKAVQESRAAYADCHRNFLEVTQELRVTREKSQSAARQSALAQSSVESLKQEYERLMDDLKELKMSEKEKDTAAMKLMAKNAALETEKDALEKTYKIELEKLRNDVLKMHQQHRDEVTRLRNDHVKIVEESKLTVTTQTDEARKALEREKEAMRERQTLRATVETLRKEARARKQVLEAANDTIVLKEAEIARLVAKSSYLQRGQDEGRRLHLAELRENSATEEVTDLPRFTSTKKMSKQSSSFDFDSLSELFPNSPSFLRLHDESLLNS